jgi:hypothetical protein
MMANHAAAAGRPNGSASAPNGNHIPPKDQGPNSQTTKSGDR